MKIESFEIVDFMGRPGTIASTLHGDINIITGRNGSGKTSLLRLIWYIISGNILLALNEVPFKRATVTTSIYTCTVHRLSHNTCKVDYSDAEEQVTFEDDEMDDDSGQFFNYAENQANDVLMRTGGSLFLPTFRRIEGGFTLTSSRRGQNVRIARAKNEVEEGLLALSKKLSNHSHLFVTSISTSDIVDLLLKQYTELSDLYTELQQNTSQEIIGTIKEFKADKQDVKRIDAANEVLDQIRAKIEKMEVERENIMTPIEAVRGLVGKLFQHTGIKISSRLSFGDAASAVNSDSLSAGEKQMLSFICYNAFYKNSIFIIDEPELSLHVDWQRQLFPILQAQQSSNQFIVATHSPFIYSKYPDKEVVVDSDRGDSGEK